MTVASETNRSGPYFGNGVTTVFSYEFRIVDKRHLKAIVTASNGAETVLVLDADYSVDGVGQEVGGSIALKGPLATGRSITLLRSPPFTQEIDLENQGAYYAETVEGALDLAVMRDQQLQEQIDRAVLIPPSQDPGVLDGLVADILRLAGSADNIDIVANDKANVDIVAGKIAAVQTVANIAPAVVAAEGNANTATTKAAAAAASATAAAGSATAAAGSATAASGSATAAATSSTNAGNSATAAAGSASAANTSKTNAATSETNAGNSASAALGSKNAAAQSATDAQAANVSAYSNYQASLTQANNAAASALLAKDWATKAEDSPVEPGLFSAMHWAKKAMAAAAAALGNLSDLINAATVKGSAADADRVPITDSAAGYGLKYVTVGNLLARAFAVARSFQADLGVGGNLTVGTANATGQTTMNGASVELGANRTVDGVAYIDFHGVAPGTSDFEARIIRMGGTNGSFQIQNLGTGGFDLSAGGGALRLAGTGLTFNSSPVLVANVNATLTAGYQADAPSDGIGSGTYTPSTVGGNFRSITNSGAFTFQAPGGANSYTMIVQILNSTTPGAITWAGFALPPDGDTYDTGAAKKFNLYITRHGGVTLGTIKAVQ